MNPRGPCFQLFLFTGTKTVIGIFVLVLFLFIRFFWQNSFKPKPFSQFNFHIFTPRLSHPFEGVSICLLLPNVCVFYVYMANYSFIRWWNNSFVFFFCIFSSIFLSRNFSQFGRFCFVSSP